MQIMLSILFILISILYFFFLMIRRPPRSTLFPYTRSSDLAPWAAPATSRTVPTSTRSGCTSSPRSEEHTSELQSHVNLVCRLLLEKKKLNSLKSTPLFNFQPNQPEPVSCIHTNTHPSPILT